MTDIIDKAKIIDTGHTDYFAYEDEDGRIWITSNPRWNDAEMYVKKEHIGEDIYRVLRELGV